MLSAVLYNWSLHFCTVQLVYVLLLCYFFDFHISFNLEVDSYIFVQLYYLLLQYTTGNWLAPARLQFFLRNLLCHRLTTTLIKRGPWENNHLLDHFYSARHVCGWINEVLQIDTVSHYFIHSIPLPPYYNTNKENLFRNMNYEDVFICLVIK